MIAADPRLKLSGRRRHESLSQAMLDASLDCVIAVGADGRVIEWNLAAERTFGYSRSAVIGVELAELIIPPEARERHRSALASSAGGGGGRLLGQRVELTAIRADGERFPAELTITRAKGAEPIFVGYIRDITRRERERLAREREARRRTAMVAIGGEALGPAALERSAEQVSELACAELEIDACVVCEREDPDGSLELVAARGDLTDARRTAPMLPVTDDATADPGGTIVRTLSVAGNVSGTIALHGVRGSDLDPADAIFVDSLRQILVNALARRRGERELEAAEHRYRGLVERLPVVSYLSEYGPEGNWLYVSPQVEQLLGFAPEEWLADRDLWWRQLHPDDRERVAAEEKRCARTLEPLSIEYRMHARDGSVLWIRDEAALGCPGDGGTVQVEGVMMNVTERRLAVEELRHRAERDELTGLANRRRFADELRRRRSRSDPAGAVAIVDVDDLKYVNDSLGHAAGDGLLRGVASALSGALLAGEFLARFGGDEFALALQVSSEAELQDRLAALLMAVRTRPSGLAARATGGAVAFGPGTLSTDEDLIIAADIALNQAKEHGGDRYSIFAGKERERLAWVGHVRDAIESDRLCLYSQPIVSVASGEQIASELLVRMIEVDGSVLPPAAFLPTAERFGLVRELDSWVVERAIAVAGRGQTVMINLSARSISDPALIARVASALARNDVDPRHVVFEITETAAATASEDLRDFGARVERLGCALAIDDFGTGFGSLTYLKHLPASYLKIDMEFVRGLSTSVADRAIVESITTIAKRLGMRTIAEGVEDAETLERLRDCGVDFAQGYHLGRPAALSAPGMTVTLP